MKVLITGAKGFIGKNFIAELKNRKGYELLLFEKETDITYLESYCKEAEFVVHLAGVNRPTDVSEYMEGNFGFTSKLLNYLQEHQNKCPIILASSIQALIENPYGQSKKAGETLLFKYSSETLAKVFVYRFPNVFGKWCKPNYNSAVATFCHNIARDLPIVVNDSSVIMRLVYIDDVIESIINTMENAPNLQSDFYNVPKEYTITLGEIVEKIYQFKASRTNLTIPSMSDDLTKKLYSTYLSYLPEDTFSYDLKMNIDERGTFTEFIKSNSFGQVSVNISKPGITKGNHWHHTKNEKFLVVSGKGVIRFRKIDSDAIIEYFVSGDKLEVVDIPCGYTHNIENLGDGDLVTIMWVNELFNHEKPDTYYLEV